MLFIKSKFKGKFYFLIISFVYSFLIKHYSQLLFLSSFGDN
jgi:hypothetical protein